MCFAGEPAHIDTYFRDDGAADAVQLSAQIEAGWSVATGSLVGFHCGRLAAGFRFVYADPGHALVNRHLRLGCRFHLRVIAVALAARAGILPAHMMDAFEVAGDIPPASFRPCRSLGARCRSRGRPVQQRSTRGPA